MKIVVFEVEDWEQDAFDALKADHEIEFAAEKLSGKNASTYSEAEIISTFIYSELDKQILVEFEHLKLIATRSTGFDHIDLDYCREKGIAICNVPTYGSNTVAEHVFGLLLTISHHLVEAIDRTRRGDFSLKGLTGFDLSGKTLGVIGTGDIGARVIEIGRGFGMRIVAYDTRPQEELAAEYGFQYLNLDDLLSESDIISLHIPANKKTHHFISQKEFAGMKDGVILINTARGNVVDIQALVRAISDGKVRAAGLDVLPEEPVIREEAELLRSATQEEYDKTALLAGHILLRLRNVVITPHSAFNTREAIQRILDTTVENISAYVHGQTQNVVPEPAVDL
jgi:D-lactate dehydrogenase